MLELRALAQLCLYGTVLNSVSTVEHSIQSVFRPDAEIVVVDGGSADGTYERLLEISKEYNLRVYRLPGSSRGLGRNYALHKCPEGSYAAYFDLDDEYNEYFHRSLEWGTAQDVPDPLPWLALREHAIARGGWRDLNYGEDAEFSVRVGFSYYVPLPMKRPMKKTRTARERRYARDAVSYLARALRAGVDDYRGNGYTLAERLRGELARAGARFVLTAPLVLAESVVANARGKYRLARALTNVELFDLLSALRAVEPRELGVPNSMASLTLIWTLALKVDLGSLAARASERAGAELRPYRCTNGRYVLAAEEALELRASSFELAGVRCEPLAPGS